MKPNKVLFIIIGILVIVNAVMLTLLWKRGDRPFERFPRHTENFLERKLDLDKNQIEEFKNSRKRHLDDIEEIQDKIGHIRMRLNEANRNERPLEVDTLIDQLGKMHMQLERVNIRHFEELRKICNADQKMMFDSLFNKITSPPRHRMHKRH